MLIIVTLPLILLTNVFLQKLHSVLDIDLDSNHWSLDPKQIWLSRFSIHHYAPRFTQTKNVTDSYVCTISHERGHFPNVTHVTISKHLNTVDEEIWNNAWQCQPACNNIHCNNKTVLILMKTKHLEDALKPKDTDTPVSNVNTRDVHWTMLPTSSVDTYPSDWKPCDLGRTVVLILETRSYDLHTTRSTTSPSINRLDYWFRWIKHLMWSIEVLLFVYTRSLWGFIIQ